MTAAEAVEEASYRKRLDAAEQEIYGGAAPVRVWRETWVPFSSNRTLPLPRLIAQGSTTRDAPCYVEPPETDAASRAQARALGELVSWWLEAFGEGAYYYEGPL